MKTRGHEAQQSAVYEHGGLLLLGMLEFLPFLLTLGIGSYLGYRSGTTAGQAIQPEQFVQSAIDRKAQVELIAVNRIQNPNTQLRDFVNIQLRIKRTAPQNQAIGYSEGVIFPGEITARNPSTGETYSAVDRMKWATSNVAVSDLKSGATADAYVWMQIPENTNRIDILIPKTQAFKDVTIAN